MSTRFPLRITATCAAIASLTACSSAASMPTTTVAPSTTIGTPSRTTVPWKPGAAVKAWNKWVKTFEVVDVSGISKSDCGVYAMLITEGSLTFYMWNGVQWMDISTDLDGGRGAMPLKVYTHDFTNDGVLDFFVTYGDNQTSGGRTYGGFFAFPWDVDKQCKWSWMDIDNGREIRKTIESPEVDQRKGIVYANGFRRGYGTYGVVDFLPSSSSFVFTEVYAK